MQVRSLNSAFEYVSQAPVVVVFIFILTASYSIELWVAGTQYGSDIEFWFAMSSTIPSSPGWFLSVFAHGSWYHLLANLSIIGILGTVLENYIGSRKTLVLIPVSGYFANLSQAIFRHIMSSEISVVGASGVGFFMMVFLPLVYYRENPEFKPGISFKRHWNNKANRRDCISLILVAVLLIAFGYPSLQFVGIVDSEGVGVVAHLAASILGILLYAVDAS